MRCEPLVVSDWCVEFHQWRCWNGGSPLPVCRNGVCACGELGSRADPRIEVRLWEGPDREPTPAGSVQHIKNWRYEGHLGASSTSRSRRLDPHRGHIKPTYTSRAGYVGVSISKATGNTHRQSRGLPTPLNCLLKMASLASGSGAPMSQLSPACRGIRDNRYKEHATSQEDESGSWLHCYSAWATGRELSLR